VADQDKYGSFHGSQAQRSSPEVNLQQSDYAARADYRLAVCMLASGSKGNAIYISDGKTSILVDAGLSGIEIERRLKSRGLLPENLQALLVSHEHSDHIQGVGVLSRRFKLPVYISRKTADAALQMGTVYEYVHFECGSTFRINELEIHPFSLSHDASDPAGFTIRRNGLKLGIATDLGTATAMVKEHLKGCTALILEANHDPAMLINGPYPWPLKQRIQSRSGHLSNLASKSLLDEIMHDRLEHVILAHLSETNNTPQEALRAVESGLTGHRVKLHVAEQNASGKILFLR
jgi:phosphoribosyl 1,2-cyclic phosphodiesterase